ncbi:Cys-Gln thioester bond-forming surface protein [Kitasatospora sp. NPDC002227]|uniref:Cys-Gln thioester bond-forming surface protein n=1 Tax=Kitasatospora sp. NPDC002227 TaxID=3154773 RepID=UPI00331F3CBB
MLTAGLVVGSGVLATGAAVATTPGGSGVTARLLPGMRHGEPVTYSVAGRRKAGEAGLFQIEADGGAQLPVYCVDLLNGTREDATYQETDWGASSLGGTAGPKIRWLLLHSYPNVAPAQLVEDAAAHGTAIDGLSEDEAAAATQVAVWSFSDPGVPVQQADAKAAALTGYLVGRAEAATDAPPGPSLALTPDAVAGASGQRLGPITVGTAGSQVELSLDRAATEAKVTLTDEAGHPVKAVKGGTRIYAQVPAGTPAGVGQITAEATVEVPAGRVFTGADAAGRHSQTLVLAGARPATTSAAASVGWAATGPAPAVSAEIDCAQSALVVTVTNSGDQDFTFTLADRTVTVRPKATQRVPVKLAEDQHYDLTLTGTGGFRKQFTGVLNCLTDSSATPAPTPPDTPATGARTPTHSATPAGGLASTGGGSDTPVLLGIAGVLMIAGGSAVFALRRRGRHIRI